MLLITSSASLLSAEEESRPDYVKEALLSSTKLDFSEALIDGKMKAPVGFMISGRQNQSLTQMVKLRSEFRRELRGSKSGAKSLGH